MTHQDSSLHPHIYHYTDAKGVYGILTEQRLWATNYKFLNDISELIHIKPTIIDVMHTALNRQAEEKNLTVVSKESTI